MKKRLWGDVVLRLTSLTDSESGSVILDTRYVA